MASVVGKFKTTGMHCSSCVMLVKLEVGDIEGVQSVDPDLASGVTTVVYDEERVTPDDIVAAVTKVGYGVEPLAD